MPVNKPNKDRTTQPPKHDVLDKRRFKSVFFQIICESCFELIFQDDHVIECDKNGVPYTTKLEQIFSKPSLKKPAKCRCCHSKEIRYYFAYCPDEIESDSDLPF